jgi:hypothetical protein
MNARTSDTLGTYMPFSELMNDNVELRKSNGTTEANLKASVQGTRIYLDAAKLPIEPGDVIVRRLSTGVHETYRVVDPGFHEAFLDLPAHYQMKVLRVEESPMSNEVISEERKQTLFNQWEEIGLDIIKQDLGNGGYRYVGGPPATRKLAMQWVRMKDAEREQDRMNVVHVSGANARVNIRSTDQSTNTVVTGGVFNEVRKALDDGVQNEVERIQLKKLLDNLEAAKDKQSFTAHYQAFIGSAANHMTIIAPFLTPLAQLLQRLTS